MRMEAHLSLLRLYTEWGVDFAMADLPRAVRAPQETGLRLPRLPQPDTASLPTALHRSPPTPRAPHPQAGGGTTRLPARARAPAGTPIPIGDSLEQAQQIAAKADTLEALLAAMNSFDGCPLRTTATHTVPPRGPLNAPLLFIGDAPDADEDRSGQVFSGRCGAALDEMLAPLPLARDTLALAPALPWRPPGGRPPSDLEQRLCRPFLERAITLLAPRHIILCGRLATHMLLGPETVPPRRQWLSFEQPGQPARPVLAMRHPLQLQASATARREIWQALMMVMQSLHTGG
ncbi:uracil-DNA glycosylase [Acetobacter papayae]|uniref:uracil-DNA glycosylase n=2 Tax=Acetobacter papayae TaxID=1076592 RepID=UPI0039ED4C60